MDLWWCDCWFCEEWTINAYLVHKHDISCSSMVMNEMIEHEWLIFHSSKISFEYPNCWSTIGFLFENMTGKEYKMESDFWTSEHGYTIDPSMSIVMIRDQLDHYQE